MTAKHSTSNRKTRTRRSLRAIGLTGAATLATIAFAAAPAQAAPAGGGMRVQECGLSQINQTYEVCGPGNRGVVISYFDSSDRSSGTVSKCWGPGVYQMITELGPFRLAVNSYEGIPC
ncbi:hypothetical protein [Prauserella cavernicola]|uniref:Streptomyces killer toxin-like beta/gamma crystallin domain-containing protein n=1 Tax=Prauserella cavernicola TaxID=2800127 RepID=A0A934QVH5_9PSEU|nr:hypothetical protein [Prauserella cavernicola]MBK1786083.1 hypothetical protein [Prauserella cavernicola]